MARFKKITILVLMGLFISTAFFKTFLIKTPIAKADMPSTYCDKGDDEFSKERHVEYYLSGTTIKIKQNDKPYPKDGCDSFKYSMRKAPDISYGYSYGFMDYYFVSENENHNHYALMVNVDSTVNPPKGVGKVQRLLYSEKEWTTNSPGWDTGTGSLPGGSEIDYIGGVSSGIVYVQNWDLRNFKSVAGPEENVGSYRALFPGGPYNFDIANIESCDTPPFIRIAGNSDIGRPEFIFTLKSVIRRKDQFYKDAVYFYFFATQPAGNKNLAIRVDDHGNLSYLMLTGKTLFTDDQDVGGKWLAQGGYNELLSKAYNGGPYSLENLPESKDINKKQITDCWHATYGEQSLNIGDILIGVTKAINAAISKILDEIVGVLDHLLIIGNLQKNEAVKDGWQSVRTAANLLLIIGLLLIALANATRFQIEYYTAKALIPRLVIAAIFINFSLLMTQVILDLGNVLTAYFLRDPTKPGEMIHFAGILSVNPETGGGAVLGLAAGTYAFFLFKEIIFVVALVAIITLLAILVFRIVLIWLLAIFSPLVFLFSVMPFTRGLGSIWWTYLTKYVFMGAVVALILKVAATISSTQVQVGEKVNGVPPPTQFLTVVAIIVLLIAAAMAPIVLGDKLAGAISGKIGDWSKGWKKSAMARSRGGAAILARRKAKEEAAFAGAAGRAARGNILSRGLSRTPLAGRFGILTQDQRAFLAKEAGKAGFSVRPPAWARTSAQRRRWYEDYLGKFEDAGGDITRLAASTWNDPDAVRALKPPQTAHLFQKGSVKAINNAADQIVRSPDVLFEKSAGVGKFMVQSILNYTPQQFQALENNALRQGYTQERINEYSEELMRRMTTDDVGSFDNAAFNTAWNWAPDNPDRIRDPNQPLNDAAYRLFTRYLTSEQVGNITQEKSLMGKGRFHVVHNIMDNARHGNYPNAVLEELQERMTLGVRIREAKTHAGTEPTEPQVPKPEQKTQPGSEAERRRAEAKKFKEEESKEIKKRIGDKGPL